MTWIEESGLPRDWYPWLRPVAHDLERLAVPIAPACYALALLDLTELDGPPVPRVDYQAGWLYLSWQAGSRWLRLDIYRDGRSVYWTRGEDSRALDASRPLRRDHAAALRDLFGWLLRGEEVHFGAWERTGKRWWKEGGA